MMKKISFAVAVALLTAGASTISFADVPAKQQDLAHRGPTSGAEEGSAALDRKGG